MRIVVDLSSLFDCEGIRATWHKDRPFSRSTIYVIPTLIPLYSHRILPSLYIRGNLQQSISPPIYMVLGCEKEPAHPRKSSTVTGRIHKLYTISTEDQD